MVCGRRTFDWPGLVTWQPLNHGGQGPMDDRPLGLCNEGWGLPKGKWNCFCQEKRA